MLADYSSGTETVGIPKGATVSLDIDRDNNTAVLRHVDAECVEFEVNVDVAAFES